MHCGATLPANQWFPERFAALGRLIAASTGAAILLTGTPGDAAITTGVATSIGASALDLTGQTTVVELAALAQRCRLYIANDCGAMHVAYAVGTPVLAIFGARFHPHVWYPYGPHSRVLRTNVPCSPCHADVCPLAERPPCLEAIAVEDAFAAASEMLDRSERKDEP
jgi:ADP-heptose:LPS heptosyltransferase